MQVEPQHVHLTVHGKARVRAWGHGPGLLCCDQQRRWVWGRFEEWFVVQGTGSVEVRLIGIRGQERVQVVLTQTTDLRPPRGKLPHRLAFKPYPAPRPRRLDAADIRAVTTALPEEDRS